MSLTSLKAEQVCAPILPDVDDVPTALATRRVVAGSDGETSVADAQHPFTRLERLLPHWDVDIDDKFCRGD